MENEYVETIGLEMKTDHTYATEGSVEISPSTHSIILTVVAGSCDSPGAMSIIYSAGIYPGDPVTPFYLFTDEWAEMYGSSA